MNEYKFMFCHIINYQHVSIAVCDHHKGNYKITKNTANSQMVLLEPLDVLMNASCSTDVHRMEVHVLLKLCKIQLLK